MADTILPMQLNKGLDLVTTPLLTEAGALIDCLNYELTDITGYRRIDGYERFDGFPDGGNTQEYYRITLDAGVNQSLIVTGTVIFALNTEAGNFEDILVVMASQGGTSYDVLPLSPNLREYLGVTDAFFYDTADPLTPTYTVTVGATITLASTLVSYATYIANLRTYSSTLRSLVYTHDRPIAGLNWLENNLYAALDTIRMTGLTTISADTLSPGMRFTYDGFPYRLVHVEASPTPTYSYMYLARESYAENDVAAPTNILSLISEQGGVIRTWIGNVTADGDKQVGGSRYAAIYKYRNPVDEVFRGMDLVPEGLNFAYNLGDTVSGSIPSITLEDGTAATDVYYAIEGGYVLKVRLTQITQTGGSFTDGTATGTAQLTIIERVAGVTPGYFRGVSELHTEYPTTATSRVLTGTGSLTGSPLAGTVAIREADTRYVWDTYNFYGQAATLSLYGTTGTSRAFWANDNGYGTINTGLSDDRDVPKYVSFHVGKLALGYAEGSVQLSVVGEPYNFSGVDGAMEIAVGDNVTGLLELPGNTLGVFGKRGVRKITGYTDTDTTLGSIASGSSCFDYSAVMVGQSAVFTGVHGITSLEQSAAHGDFVGERLSSQVSPWLRPKLVREFTSLELGGVVCAMPVRNKQQYRLFLKTGEVLVCTLTSDGPRLTFSNYGLDGEIRVPFAWSSATDADGQEKLHVCWDVTGEEEQAYTLDRGWAFDGAYFQHYFDIAHVFDKYGVAYSGIERVRMYGQGYGVATLNIKSAGIESNFDQDYHEAIQDISMPATPSTFYGRMQPVTAIVDQANWGIGIKLRISNTTTEGTTVATEPSHICQVLVLHLRTDGAGDN